MGLTSHLTARFLFLPVPEVRVTIYLYISIHLKEKIMLCSLSNLNSQDIDQVRTLEKELGITVLAFSCHEAEPALLDKETLDKIQAAEDRLGLSLVAVKS